MEGQDGLPPTPGSELTALTSANLQALTAGAPGTAPGRKAPVRKRRGGKKRKRKHTAGDAPRHISLASPAGSWSGRTPARGAPGWQGARQEQAARKAGSAPWTTPRTVPPAPFNSTEDILDRKEEGGTFASACCAGTAALVVRGSAHCVCHARTDLRARAGAQRLSRRPTRSRQAAPPSTSSAATRTRRGTLLRTRRRAATMVTPAQRASSWTRCALTWPSSSFTSFLLN
jgi:hypothetical protein